MHVFVCIIIHIYKLKAASCGVRSALVRTRSKKVSMYFIMNCERVLFVVSANVQECLVRRTRAMINK